MFIGVTSELDEVKQATGLSSSGFAIPSAKTQEIEVEVNSCTYLRV